MNFRKVIKKYAETPISRHLILEILSDYKRPNDKISELIKSKELISIKRGLYMVGPETDLPQPTPFLIANHIHGPSYISLESALSYWDMIPERVFEIISVTTKKSKKYHSPAGRFSYQHLKTPYYSYGLKNEKITPNQNVLIASPEKALCDKIILTPNITFRSIKQALLFLTEDLRISHSSLTKLDYRKIELWSENAPKKSSLEILAKTLKTIC